MLNVRLGLNVRGGPGVLSFSGLHPPGWSSRELSSRGLLPPESTASSSGSLVLACVSSSPRDLPDEDPLVSFSVITAGVESKGGMRSGNREGFSPTRGPRLAGMGPLSRGGCPLAQQAGAGGHGRCGSDPRAGRRTAQRPETAWPCSPPPPDPRRPALGSVSCLPHSLESRPRSPYFKTELGSGWRRCSKAPPPGVCVSKCGSCSQAAVGPRAWSLGAHRCRRPPLNLLLYRPSDSFCGSSASGISHLLPLEAACDVTLCL